VNLATWRSTYVVGGVEGTRGAVGARRRAPTTSEGRDGEVDLPGEARVVRVWVHVVRWDAGLVPTSDETASRRDRVRRVVKSARTFARGPRVCGRTNGPRDATFDEANIAARLGGADVLEDEARRPDVLDPMRGWDALVGWSAVLDKTSVPKRVHDPGAVGDGRLCARRWRGAAVVERACHRVEEGRFGAKPFAECGQHHPVAANRSELNRDHFAERARGSRSREEGDAAHADGKGSTFAGKPESGAACIRGVEDLHRVHFFGGLFTDPFWVGDDCVGVGWV